MIQNYEFTVILDSDEEKFKAGLELVKETFARFNVDIVGRPHYGHEDCHAAYLTGVRINNRNRRTTEVDKKLFAGTMLLAHGETSRFFPLPVATAEVRVSHRFVTRLCLVFHPQQLPRHTWFSHFRIEVQHVRHYKL